MSESEQLYYYQFAPSAHDARYRVLGKGKGAGEELRGQIIVSYQDILTGEVYFRVQESFDARMVRVE